MGEKYYGLIEMSCVFGLVLAVASWELYSLRRDKKRKLPETTDRESRESPPKETGP
jgi:hypothetical protein